MVLKHDFSEMRCIVSQSQGYEMGDVDYVAAKICRKNLCQPGLLD